MASISFTVPGKPQSKERPRLGRGGSVYTPSKTKVYEALVARHAKKAMQAQSLAPFDGPVYVELVMCFAIPKSWPKYKQQAARDGLIWGGSRVDIDNCTKSALDGMNAVVYVDDRQVVQSKQVKVYGEAAHVKITIRELRKWEKQAKGIGQPTTWSAGPLTPSSLTLGTAALTAQSR